MPLHGRTGVRSVCRATSMPLRHASAAPSSSPAKQQHLAEMPPAIDASGILGEISAQQRHIASDLVPLAALHSRHDGARRRRCRLSRPSLRQTASTPSCMSLVDDAVEADARIVAEQAKLRIGRPTHARIEAQPPAGLALVCDDLAPKRRDRAPPAAHRRRYRESIARSPARWRNCARRKSHGTKRKSWSLIGKRRAFSIVSSVEPVSTTTISSTMPASDRRQGFNESRFVADDQGRRDVASNHRAKESVMAA